jgi:hypothetical protein
MKITHLFIEIFLDIFKISNSGNLLSLAEQSDARFFDNKENAQINQVILIQELIIML